MFGIFRTFSNPAQGANAQRGFPAPGTGQQTIGNRPGLQGNPGPAPEPERPTQGKRTWFKPAAPQSAARGFPAPQGPAQRRDPGFGPGPLNFGGVIYHKTRQYSRGANAFVPTFGKVLENPIGAGVVALYRPQASYGLSGQYQDGQIFWATQTIPTSINLQGLTDPDELLAILGELNVVAAVRTTG